MKKKIKFNAVKVLLTQLLQNEFTNEWRNGKSALEKKRYLYRMNYGKQGMRILSTE